MRAPGFFVTLLAVGAGSCSSGGTGNTRDAGTAGLPAGPVPVSLPSLEAHQRRALTQAAAFVTIDARGEIRFGEPEDAAPDPYAGESHDRRDSLFAELFMRNGRRHRRETYVIRYDLDAYATLITETSADVVILADAATPARITLRDAIEEFGYRRIVIAASAANSVAPYAFGGEPWTPWGKRADLTLRVDRLDDLVGKHPRSVLLEFTDENTTGELVTALGALGQAGVARVRVHRMMGWGEIPPTEIVWVHGPTAEDDEFTDSGRVAISMAEPRVNGDAKVDGVSSALRSYLPRFAYCYAKRPPEARGKRLELAFDLAADGKVSGATATGIDARIASCVAGAVFDLDLAHVAIRAGAHVTVAIAFGGEDARKPPEPAIKEPAKAPSGFWCWTHPDGNFGLCARHQDQCESALYGSNLAASALHEAVIPGPCQTQREAWTSNGRHFKPTRQACGKSCRKVR